MSETSAILKFKRRLDYIDVDSISPNPNNPREPISRKEIRDILDSIKTIGCVLVPIVVYEINEGEFVLLDGERRWRACKELSRQNPDFKKIPANVIEKPLTEFQNLQTMFNIHQKRKEWSTAAIAESIGRLLELKGELSTGEIARLTGVDSTSVNDALLLLKFPRNIRMRCLNGELDEFYPILLGRNLKRLEKIFPSLFKKYSWKRVAHCFLEKVDAGFIRNTRDFNKLGKMASLCISYESEQLFESVFHKMIADDRFAILDAESEIERELGYKLEESFRTNCANFLKSLSSYLGTKGSIAEIPDETVHILNELYTILKSMIEQKKLF